MWINILWMKSSLNTTWMYSNHVVTSEFKNWIPFADKLTIQRGTRKLKRVIRWINVGWMSGESGFSFHFRLIFCDKNYATKMGDTLLLFPFWIDFWLYEYAYFAPLNTYPSGVILYCISLLHKWLILIYIAVMHNAPKMYNEYLSIYIKICIHSMNRFLDLIFQKLRFSAVQIHSNFKRI